VQLLDKAVRMISQLDEPPESNYVRKHVLAQVAEDDCDVDEAAVRVFSNAPGNYGTNVNFMVMDSQ
jgi:magnesium chelatase subunit H